MTQRDRLVIALVSAHARLNPGRAIPLEFVEPLADALIARGVRVVDEDTLAALPTHVPAGHEWECVSCNYKNNRYVTDDGRRCALDYDAAIGRDDLYAALEIKP